LRTQMLIVRPVRCASPANLGVDRYARCFLEAEGWSNASVCRCTEHFIITDFLLS